MIGKLWAYLKKRPLDRTSRDKISQIEQVIGESIESPRLYFKALRHRSLIVEQDLSTTDSYEQLEFLGDAVLDLVVSELIYTRYPASDEGFMTKLRSKVVKKETLAYLAEQINLGEIIEVGNRVREQGVEHTESVLADSFEALIGALYLDKGFDTVSSFVNGLIERFLDLDHLIKARENYKSLLLEYAQGKKMPIPEYRVAGESGPSHDKLFKVNVIIGESVVGTGSGKNKKKAEQSAAMQALTKLKNQNQTSDI